MGCETTWKASERFTRTVAVVISRYAEQRILTHGTVLSLVVARATGSDDNPAICEDFFERVVEAMAETLFLMEATGRIMKVNQATAEPRLSGQSGRVSGSGTGEDTQGTHVA